MKLIVTSTLLSLIFACLCASCSQESNQYAIVGVRSGLVLREKPGTGEMKITVIPANGKLLVLGQGKEETIDKVRGRWTEVSYYDLRGWVFGGYLLPCNAIRVAYVRNLNGMALHKDADPASPQTALAPYREKVEVTDPCGVPIDKKSGDIYGYIKVTGKSGRGYAYESDLSFIPIPDYGIKYDPKDAPKYQASVLSFFTSTMYRFGDTREKIIAALGTPVKLATSTEPNKHEAGKINEIHALTYDGLSIAIMKTPSGNELMLSMDITSDARFPGGTLLNTPVQSAFQRFGVPGGDNGTDFSYITDDSGYCEFTLHAPKGTITRITFFCTPD